ncbi:hypothetical protein T492DRAFT_899970, partial [Pavlovales sp. CCMP2436]
DRGGREVTNLTLLIGIRAVEGLVTAIEVEGPVTPLALLIGIRAVEGLVTAIAVEGPCNSPGCFLTFSRSET